MINLTRFDLFYPEKRDFFLEGAGTFRFGASHRAQVFCSRRIGLSEAGEAIPIMAGGRVTGKVGRYNLGLLNIQTAKKGLTRSSNFAVVRVKRDVLRSSTVGFIFTNKAERGGHWNRAGGVDFSYLTGTLLGDKSLEVSGFIASTQTPGLKGDNLAGRILVDHPNNKLDVYLQPIQAAERDVIEKEAEYTRDKAVMLPEVDSMACPRREEAKAFAFNISQLSINLPLDLQKSLLRYSKAGKARLDEARFVQKRAEDFLVCQVKTAYFVLLTKQTEYLTGERALEYIRHHLEVVQSLRNTGIRTELDLLRVKAEMERVDAELESERASLEEARVRLNPRIGLDFSRSTRVEFPVRGPGDLLGETSGASSQGGGVESHCPTRGGRGPLRQQPSWHRVQRHLRPLAHFRDCGRGSAAAIGILVENTIVVVENSVRHLREGEKAVLKATTEILPPLFCTYSLLSPSGQMIDFWPIK